MLTYSHSITTCGGTRKRPQRGRFQTFVIPDLIRDPFSQRCGNGPRIKSRVAMTNSVALGRTGPGLAHRFRFPKISRYAPNWAMTRFLAHSLPPRLGCAGRGSEREGGCGVTFVTFLTKRRGLPLRSAPRGSAFHLATRRAPWSNIARKA